MRINTATITKNDKNRNNYKKYKLLFFAVIIVIIFLVIIGIYNFLFFHTVIEFWAMLVAASIFIISWNTRNITGDNFLLFLGTGYLFICILTFFHTITYSGVEVLQVSTNEPTQFWMGARFLETFLFLGTAYYYELDFLHNPKRLIFIFSAITALIIITILIYPVFPDSLLPEEGLTVFKIYGEYIIILIMFFTILKLKKRQEFSPGFYNHMIIVALGLSIIAELAFTLYNDVYGILNFTGHIFYLASFIVVYYVIVERSLNNPLNIIFRKLSQKTEKLQENNYFLEEVLEALSHPFYVINVNNYEVELANSSAQKLNNDNNYKADFCYRMTHNQNHPCNSENHICPLEEIKKTKKPVFTEHIHQDENGDNRYFEIHGYPVFDDKQNLKYLIEYSLDITQRKISERKLNEYTMELELQSIELENTKERLNEEINKARKIHENTLPEFNQMEFLEVYAYYQPAANLGGDFYHFTEHGENFVFYISDITGHGLDAAMMNSFVKNTISTYIDLIPETERIDPQEVLEFLSSRYKQENYPDDFFITILLGVINPAKEQLIYCSAGMHVHPLLIKDHKVTELPAGNMPVSVLISESEMFLHNESVDIPSGSLLFFSTDGLTEQTSGDRTYNKRHYNILKEKQLLSTGEIASQINKDFYNFSGKKTGDDDITYLIIKIKE